MKLLRHKTAGMARQACLALALFCATAGAIADEKPVLAITVTGASEEVRENILARLPSYRPLCSATRDEAENYLLSAQPKIDSAIRAMGFYTATSESRIARNADCWELTVAVKQGKPVTISSQRVTLSGPGRDDPVLRELVSRLPYAQGDIFRHDSYESYKSRLEQQASGRGYFDAQFPVHEILVNPRTHTADVRLQLDTGERYRYGSVSVEQTVLTPDYAEKYILIREGESFSSEELIKQQQLLQSSGYYADVRVTPLYRKARGGQVPVEISATPVKKHAYDARVGYGTDTGFRVGFDYERRWVSDKGAKIEASIGYSQKLIFGDISYVVPAKRRLNEYTRYTLGWRREYGEDVESKSIELGAEYVRKRSGWEQAAFLRYLDDVTQAVGEPELESRFLIAGMRFQKSSADNRLYPRKGWLLRAELQGAYEGFLSSNSFLQATLHAKLIRPLGKGRLIVRGDIGSTRVDSLSQLPKSLRYFAGGDNSVRGYDFESLGEKNAAGAIVGGKHLLIASLEYEHPLKDDWGLALFVDTGNAFDDWNNMELQTGVGFGARWKSPIGPVRVDLAWPTDDFSDPHLHLSIGPDL